MLDCVRQGVNNLSKRNMSGNEPLRWSVRGKRRPNAEDDKKRNGAGRNMNAKEGPKRRQIVDSQRSKEESKRRKP